MLSRSLHRALIVRGFGWLSLGDVIEMGAYSVIRLCLSGKGQA